MNFSSFKVLSFDCYGTLIDWESGILGALRPVFAAHRAEVDDASILRTYAELELALENGPYQSYRTILTTIVAELGERFGFSPTDEEQRSLPDSVAGWLPFPDTVDCLQQLKAKHRLGILSNVDDDLFSNSARRLGVEFDFVITAQQLGAYKPSASNFAAVAEKIAGMGFERNEWLHIAQSRAHDIAPANALGIANVWVNRPALYGASAVTEALVEPYCTVASLAELAQLMR